jgi:hypothetical protein
LVLNGTLLLVRSRLTERIAGVVRALGADRKEWEEQTVGAKNGRKINKATGSVAAQNEVKNGICTGTKNQRQDEAASTLMCWPHNRATP